MLYFQNPAAIIQSAPKRQNHMYPNLIPLRKEELFSFILSKLKQINFKGLTSEARHTLRVLSCEAVYIRSDPPHRTQDTLCRWEDRLSWHWPRTVSQIFTVASCTRAKTEDSFKLACGNCSWIYINLTWQDPSVPLTKQWNQQT